MRLGDSTGKTGVVGHYIEICHFGHDCLKKTFGKKVELNV